MIKDDEYQMHKHPEEGNSEQFLSDAQESVTREETIRALFRSKRKRIIEKEDEDIQPSDDEREAWQAALEADERYQQIREFINHPDFDVLINELQEYVESYIESMLQENAPAKTHKMTNDEIVEWQNKLLSRKGLVNRSWKVEKRMGKISDYDIQRGNLELSINQALYGKIEISLVSFFNKTEKQSLNLLYELFGSNSNVDHHYSETSSPSWHLSIKVYWDRKAQTFKMAYSNTSGGPEWIPVASFNELLDHLADITSNAPTFWEEESLRWEERMNKIKEEYPEEFELFQEIYRQQTGNDISKPRDLFFVARRSGLSVYTIETNVERVVKRIHLQLEPLRLLRQIASNTERTATNTSLSATSTNLSALSNAAIQQLAQEGNITLGSINVTLESIKEQIKKLLPDTE